ncbi:MAG TPA: RIP metalloprotease RseP [Terriglobales bacterium]|jgi:regulator of sigma E protease|nr:RIP metalloprotease RseP [Terriglobales bacterium]
MYNAFTILWAVALVLGILILIHELGHFVTAKLFGVRVEVFSIGFGKRLLGWRKGDTDYRISALPLGGYVKMAGENPMEARTGDPGEFVSHPRWQRFIIAAAGPAMNILLAIALLTGVFMVRYEHPYFLDQPAVIGWVLENSPASKGGFEAGDRIVRIGNTQSPTWEDVEAKLMLNPGQPLDVAIQRGGQILQKTIVPDKQGPEDYGALGGWIPQEPNIVTQIEPDMPAAKAGMKVGDEVVAVNGVTMRSMRALIHALQQNQGKPLDVAVTRNGQELHFNVTPVLSHNAHGGEQWRMGFISNPVHVDKLGFADAFAKSIETNKRYSVLILELVRQLVARKVSMKQIDGPIGIARASGEAARQGWMPLLALMAAISLNLGIFNLFPIPIMDGGVILLLAIESVMRRDISMKIKERIYQAAFVFLILFAVVVIYNDIGKALPGLAKFLP